MRIVSVVGTRPNFMKLFPVARALAARPEVEHVVIHTGQHYDPLLSDRLFQDLELPAPDHHLDVGSGTQAGQTATAMLKLEPLLAELAPDVVLVYGDVNSTLAAALVAAKLGLRLAHVEAGLRSGDRTMPEEINRLVTDRLADLLFTPSPDAVANLRAEGMRRDAVVEVGNVMIDTLVTLLPRARQENFPARHRLDRRRYAVATFHRPANVDAPKTLRAIMETLRELSAEIPVLLPVHPRTAERLRVLGWHSPEGPRILPPLGYLEMLGLVADAAVVLTDSGGVQEETTYLGVPCVTVRPSTERPITCSAGTNRLVAPQRDIILTAVRTGIAERRSVAPVIPLWDGMAGERIATALCGARVLEPTAGAFTTSSVTG